VDFTTALTKIVEALAWPATVLVAVFMFRNKIDGLLDRIKAFKGWGAEVELEEKIQIAKAEAVVAGQKVVEAANAPAEQREQVITQFVRAQKEVDKLVNQRLYLGSKLRGNGLTEGRERILREFIRVLGPGRIVELSHEDLRKKWPSLLKEAQKKSPQLHHGAMLGLQSVGLIDNSDQLTVLGSEIFAVLAREMQLYEFENPGAAQPVK
jgi:hypothetical protein